MVLVNLFVGLAQRHIKRIDLWAQQEKERLE